MRIIQFIPSLRTGGAETLATYYAIEMSKLGHDVYCFVYDGDLGEYPNKEALLSSDVTIIFLSDRVRWYYKTTNLLTRCIRAVIRRQNIIKTLKQIKPDVVHFHLTPFNIILRIIKEYPCAKFFYTIHSELSSVFKDKRNLELARSAVSKHKIQIIALHKKMKVDCDRILYDNSTICINNGIDLEKFYKAQKYRDICRSKFKIKTSDFVVGHIGSFMPVKNHEYLFKIFQLIKKCRADTWLMLVGEGYLKDKFKALTAELGINDNIIWLEKRNDIPQLLSCMDVFVFPSKYEGYPLSVLEAQAAGVRCIVSENITDEVLVTDRIIKMNISLDPNEWCKEILNPSLYEAHQGIESYDIRIIVRKLLKLYGGER